MASLLSRLRKLTSLLRRRNRGLSGQLGTSPYVVDGGRVLPLSVSYASLVQRSLAHQHHSLCHTEPQTLPICSEIGMGVYQGKAVAFHQTEACERHWVLNRLQFDELNLFPDEALQSLRYLACLLSLHLFVQSAYPEQLALLKTCLQTTDGIALMRYCCPYLQSQPRSETFSGEQSNHEQTAWKEIDQLRELFRQLALACPYRQDCIANPSHNQPSSTHEGEEK